MTAKDISERKELAMRVARMLSIGLDNQTPLVDKPIASARILGRFRPRQMRRRPLTDDPREER